MGIYGMVEGPSSPTLLKLAYRGVDSRGLFPVTEEFAKQSNNASCALWRRAKIVDDTRCVRSGRVFPNRVALLLLRFETLRAPLNFHMWRSLFLSLFGPGLSLSRDASCLKAPHT